MGDLSSLESTINERKARRLDSHIHLLFWGFAAAAVSTCRTQRGQQCIHRDVQRYPHTAVLGVSWALEILEKQY